MSLALFALAADLAFNRACLRLRLRFDRGEVNAERGKMSGTEPKPLTPGLYLVATPIGSARDITLRALDVLAGADVIAAEDTRTTRKLMDIHGIALAGRPLIAYHDHSGVKAREMLRQRIEAGASVAYASEAGSPLIADPGYGLVQEMAAAGLEVTSVPGASALVAALSVAGLPTDRFLFAGFLPVKPGARRKTLEGVADLDATLVFYESAGRIERSLKDMVEIFGGERPGAICRELTKRFEQIMREPLGTLADSLGSDITLKGEFIIVVGPAAPRAPTAEEVDEALGDALVRLSVKDAASEVAERLKLPRKEVYSRALALK